MLTQVFDRYALPALMSFDLAGIIFKWRMFDHYVSYPNIFN